MKLHGAEWDDEVKLSTSQLQPNEGPESLHFVLSFEHLMDNDRSDVKRNLRTRKQKFWIENWVMNGKLDEENHENITRHLELWLLHLSFFN